MAVHTSIAKAFLAISITGGLINDPSPPPIIVHKQPGQFSSLRSHRSDRSSFLRLDMSSEFFCAIHVLLQDIKNLMIHKWVITSKPITSLASSFQAHRKESHPDRDEISRLHLMFLLHAVLFGLFKIFVSRQQFYFFFLRMWLLWLLHALLERAIVAIISPLVYRVA